MAKRFYWNELTSPEFAALDAETTIAILPVASTEQHGAHLPISTDVTIANGMIAAVRAILPDHLDVLVLPTQEIGKANEHIHGPGTLSFGADILIPGWTAIGQKVAEAGIRKLVIVNSHGSTTRNKHVCGFSGRDAQEADQIGKARDFRPYLPDRICYFDSEDIPATTHGSTDHSALAARLSSLEIWLPVQSALESIPNQHIDLKYQL